MPSNKIIVILIICVGLVTSIWLINRDTPIKIDVSGNKITATNNDSKTNLENNDWKKLLNTANPITQNILSDFSKTPTIPEETTLTGQLSTDLMAEYLLLKQGGREITETDIDNLTQKILSIPEYTSVTSAVYTEKNLRVVENSKKLIDEYKLTAGGVISIRLRQIKDDPVLALVEAMNTNNPTSLKKIDNVILVNKGIISDFLAIQVPKQAVKIHLDLMNSFSKILYDLEAMRVFFDDPVRGLIGLNNYKNHILEFLNALENLNEYIR